MNTRTLLSRYLIAGIFVIFCTRCEESFMTRDQSTIGGKTFGHGGGHEGPGSYTDHPNGDRYPYPEIIEKEYIPPYRPFAYTKCLAWRITWPEYQPSADIEKIPTVFTTGNGALNSFYYLNNVGPQTTYNTKFNLYYEEKLVSSNVLWDELDYTFNGGDYMELVRFAKSEQTVSSIQYWVEERPDLFEINYGGVGVDELEYQEGDFFIFFLTEQKLHGGVRIVSMTPRIIEVYLAVPND